MIGTTNISNDIILEKITYNENPDGKILVIENNYRFWYTKTQQDLSQYDFLLISPWIQFNDHEVGDWEYPMILISLKQWGTDSIYTNTNRNLIRLSDNLFDGTIARCTTEALMHSNFAGYMFDCMVIGRAPTTANLTGNGQQAYVQRVSVVLAPHRIFFCGEKFYNGGWNHLYNTNGSAAKWGAMHLWGTWNDNIDSQLNIYGVKYPLLEIAAGLPLS